MRAAHERIETIAGAIALGEATQDERRQYREHLTSCRACLDALGGEHEIERTAAVVGHARESEVWEPRGADLFSRERKRHTRLVGATTVACLAIAGVFAGAHFFRTGHVSAPTPTNMQQVATVDSAPAKDVPAPAPQRHLVVVHNIVQMARSPVMPAPAPVHAQPAQAQAAPSKPTEIAAVTVHPQDDSPPAASRGTSVKSNVPIWRRDGASWRTVARTTTTSMIETAPAPITHHAESIQMNLTTRDASVVGGATALNPQPPQIAYDEGAQGTSAFEVLIDDHGNPTKCVITKSAGYLVLDDTVCRAAMRARYTPKMVDGRAVPGVYHDAFTFQYNNSTIDALPHPIHF